MKISLSLNPLFPSFFFLVPVVSRGNRQHHCFPLPRSKADGIPAEEVERVPYCPRLLVATQVPLTFGDPTFSRMPKICLPEVLSAQVALLSVPRPVVKSSLVSPPYSPGLQSFPILFAEEVPDRSREPHPQPITLIISTLWATVPLFAPPFFFFPM